LLKQVGTKKKIIFVWPLTPSWRPVAACPAFGTEGGKPFRRSAPGPVQCSQSHQQKPTKGEKHNEENDSHRRSRFVAVCRRFNASAGSWSEPSSALLSQRMPDAVDPGRRAVPGPVQCSKSHQEKSTIGEKHNEEDDSHRRGRSVVVRRGFNASVGSWSKPRSVVLSQRMPDAVDPHARDPLRKHEESGSLSGNGGLPWLA
jgi:hypothetical protein